MKINGNYNHTIYASYIGYITQAIVNCFLPLLFITLNTQYGISFDKLALLITINFGVQFAVDLLSARYAERIGYKRGIIAAHIFAAAGLIGLAVFPDIFPSEYYGIVAAVALYGVGGGIIEVLISPIVEACPTERKEAAMSLLHSFYCWGVVFVTLFSTVFFGIFGIENWKILACIWALIPLFNCVYFSKVPVKMLVSEEEKIPVKTIFKNKDFWILCLLMMCAGASELGMSQWASAFAEAGLNVSKTAGDLAGPCAFAALMGVARVLYAKFSEKISLKNFISYSAILCVISYLIASLSANPVIALVGCALCGFSVGIMWPGTISIAAKSVKNGGTAVFAILALFGDLGCSAGPYLVGIVSEKMGQDLKAGLLSAVIFPVLLIVGLKALREKK